MRLFQSIAHALAGTPQQHTPVATPPEPVIPEALLPAPGPLSTRLLAQASQPAGMVCAGMLRWRTAL